MAGAGGTGRKILAATLLAVAWATVAKGAPQRASGKQTRRPMPGFELEALDGSRFSSRALAGKVALVDLWATWCKPCIEEIPRWNELLRRYEGRGFAVLGIAIQSGWATDIKADIEKFDFEINYPVVVGNQEIERAFGGVLAFPTTFLITREGKIYKKYVGEYENKHTEIEADIKELLSRKS